jgi:hypothetical protein
MNELTSEQTYVYRLIVNCARQEGIIIDKYAIRNPVVSFDKLKTAGQYDSLSLLQITKDIESVGLIKHFYLNAAQRFYAVLDPSEIVAKRLMSL